MLLKTHGIEFSREPVAEMQEFAYRWMRIPDQREGQSTVWCRKQADLLAILNHWNRDRWWKYWI